MLDAAPDETPRDEYMFVFAEWPNGSIELLANRTGAASAIDPGTLVEETGNHYTKLDGKTVETRICQFLDEDEAEHRDGADSEVRELPDEATNVIFPQRQFTPERWDDLASRV
jgi:hypothetical protein